MNENFSSLPQEDRPYERCIRHGVQSLSNRDLLAVILRTGAKGRNVLELAGDLLKLVPEREGFTGIRRLSLDELSKCKRHRKSEGRSAEMPSGNCQKNGERGSRRRHSFYIALSGGKLLYGRSAS